MIITLLNKIKTFYYKFRYIETAGKGLRIEGFPQFKGDPKIICGNYVTIAPYIRFRGPGEIYLGDYVHLSSGVIIDSKEKVFIGNYSLIGEYTTITDSDHNYKYEGIERHRSFVTKPTHISENVWIGGRCAVLKGVNIGANVVVGANTVVTESLPEKTVVTGVKGTVIKRLPQN